MKILLVGDIVGKGGVRAASQLIGQLRQQYNCCFCIANGENAVKGAGLTQRTARELLGYGIDVMTTGDHVWDQREFISDIGSLPQVLRPANLNDRQPGRGYGVYKIPIGGTVAVINLIGRVFMKPEMSCPFAAVDKILQEVGSRTNTVFVDIHAEATSEKIAMGRYLDGRVTAVFGTHTHVQTADACVLPDGTAYVTDLGMVGSTESILGREIDDVLRRFTTGLPNRLRVVEDGIELRGAVVDFDPTTGLANGIETIAVPAC